MRRGGVGFRTFFGEQRKGGAPAAPSGRSVEM